SSKHGDDRTAPSCRLSVLQLRVTSERSTTRYRLPCRAMTGPTVVRGAVRSGGVDHPPRTVDLAKVERYLLQRPLRVLAPELNDPCLHVVVVGGKIKLAHHAAFRTCRH